jgi:hypothetical protein
MAAVKTTNIAAIVPSNAAPTKSMPGKHRIGDDGPVRVVEIRSYRLLPGTRDEYDRLFREEALPLLRRFDVDVIAAGPSIDDPNGYFLIRAFGHLSEREQREDRFYSSPEWRNGPREAVISKIEVYTDVVVELDEATIEALRHALARN